MRITITLHHDLAEFLRRLAQARRMKLSEVANLALREGLNHLSAPKKRRTSFRTRSVNLGSCRIGNIDNVTQVLAVAEGESFK